MAAATHGYVKGLADDLDVRLARMYELLSKDNPYPKLKRILGPLGRRNADGLRLVQADFNAWCDSVLSDSAPAVSTAELHKELNEVIQAELDKKPTAVQRVEIRQAISLLVKRMDQLDSSGKTAASGIS
jgi:hypothetical protein